MSFYQTKQEVRITTLPTDNRLRLYDEVVKLKKQNLKPFEIFKLFNSKGLNIKYETIRRWHRNKMSPYNKINSIKNFKEDLAEVIGLAIGDGCPYKKSEKNGTYNTGRVTFGVKDKDLAERFALLLRKVLGKNKPYSIYFDDNSEIYVTYGHSKELIELLKDFDKLKIFIEKYPKNFLRGLYDAEGCSNIKFTKNRRAYARIFLTNSDLNLINYVKSLLENFGIRSNISLNTKGGKYKFIKGKYTLTNEDCYNLCIENIDGARKFKKLINFSLERKSKKLNNIVSLIDKYGTDGAFQRLKLNN